MRNTSIKEYIGARYVPKFYEDAQGGAEWNANDDYEPLTIVTHEGNSYTSRQYVPAGIQITNKAYWLETGNWNSQIESYRREVLQFADDIQSAHNAADAAQETADGAVTAARNAQTTADGAVTTANTATARINTIEKRGIFAGKLVTIGDSYDAGWTPDGNNTGWGTVLAQMCGATGHVDKWQGGCGFVTINSGKNFYVLLQDAVASIPLAERADYTAVVIAGGFNDGGATPSQALDAITNCANYVQNNLPNAQLVIAFIPWSRYPDTVGGPSRRFALHSYERGTIGNKCRFIADAYMALAIKEDTRLASDGRHPTQEGQNAIAQHIYNVCQGGEMEYVLPETNITHDMIYTFKNKCLELNKYGGGFIPLNNVTPGNWNGRKFGEIEPTTDLPFDPPSGKAVYNGVSLMAMVQYSYNDQHLFTMAQATLRIERKNIIAVYLTAIMPDGSNWLLADRIPEEIFIPQGCYRFPVMDL